MGIAITGILGSPAFLRCHDGPEVRIFDTAMKQRVVERQKVGAHFGETQSRLFGDLSGRPLPVQQEGLSPQSIHEADRFPIHYIAK
jgi:hypothetical protein